MGATLVSSNVTLKVSATGVGAAPSTGTTLFTIPANSYGFICLWTASAVSASVNNAGSGIYATPATASYYSGQVWLAPGTVSILYASGTAPNYVYVVFSNSP